MRVRRQSCSHLNGACRGAEEEILRCAELCDVKVRPLLDLARHSKASFHQMRSHPCGDPCGLFGPRRHSLRRHGMKETSVAEWMMDDVVAAQRLDAAALQLSQVDGAGVLSRRNENPERHMIITHYLQHTYPSGGGLSLSLHTATFTRDRQDQTDPNSLYTEVYF